MPNVENGEFTSQNHTEMVWSVENGECMKKTEKLSRPFNEIYFEISIEFILLEPQWLSG